MPVRPEDISLSALPRARRGVDPEAAEELLRKAAWELLAVQGENAQLRQTLAELTARGDELERKIAALQSELGSQKGPDEIARALLDAARRAAREHRESTRVEMEQMLKKARERARELEGAARERAQAAAAELAELEARRRALAAELRAAIDSIVRIAEEAHGDVPPAPAAEPAGAEEASEDGSAPIVALERHLRRHAS